MKALRYFLTRLKCHIKSAPIVILVSLLTAGAVAALGVAIVKNNAERDDGEKLLKVGVVGDMSQRYIELVIDTMKNLDDSRLSIDFVVMEEDDAKDAVRSGEVIGYLIIPDGFVDAAARAEFISTTYVTEGADTALGDALIAEFMQVAEKLADAAQSSVFGAERYMFDRGATWETADKLTDGFTLRYAEYMLKRNAVLDINIVGEAATVPLGAYYFSAFVLFFAMLFGIACASHLVRRDQSLPKLLSSRRLGATRQVVCEFAAYFIFSFIFLFVITVLGGAVVSDESVASLTGGKTLGDFALIALSLAPASAMIAAAQIFLYECASGVVGGVLLQFTAAISTAYISGYFYPSAFFPATVQKVARVLPGGVAFSYAKGLFAEGKTSSGALPFLLLYTALFIALASVVRKIKTGGDEG